MPTRPTVSLAPLSLLAWGVLAAGVLLLGFTIVVEDEPGALPLALVVLGLVGVVWTRRTSR